MIVAFGHRRGMGKDTAAKLLHGHLHLMQPNSTIERVGFATKLYDICHQLYSWAGFKTKAHYDQFPSEKEVKLPLLGKTPREILLQVGEDFRNNVYKETWIQYLLHAKTTEHLIITDMRHVNEASAVKELGGICIKIVRPDVAVVHEPVDDALDVWTGWDHYVENGQDIKYLDYLMSELCDKLFRKK